MSFTHVLIILVSSSFAGIIILLGFRFYAIRNLTEEELRAGITAGRPFFSDFSASGLIAMGAARKGSQLIFDFSKKGVNKTNPHVSRFVAGLKFYHCRLSNYLHGRNPLDSNGCKGYWNELNETKNGNGENT